MLKHEEKQQSCKQEQKKKTNRESKNGRYQNIWKHGNCRKAEGKDVVFNIETCRKTTVIQAGIENKKHRKQKDIKSFGQIEKVEQPKEKVQFPI